MAALEAAAAVVAANAVAAALLLLQVVVAAAVAVATSSGEEPRRRGLPGWGAKDAPAQGDGRVETALGSGWRARRAAEQQGAERQAAEQQAVWYPGRAKFEVAGIRSRAMSVEAAKRAVPTRA